MKRASLLREVGESQEADDKLRDEKQPMSSRPKY